MQRTGNNIGGEGRRQHNPDDPSNGDKQRMQERLADAEIGEGIEERERSEGVEGQPQADGDPYGDEDVGAPEGVKPATEHRIEKEGLEGAEPSEENERR